jgi:hypothetical protein
LERLILRLLWQLLYHYDCQTAKTQVERLKRLILLGQRLNIGLSLAQAQETYFRQLHEWLIPECRRWCESYAEQESTARSLTPTDLYQLLNVGQFLMIDTHYWLQSLPA